MKSLYLACLLIFLFFHCSAQWSNDSMLANNLLIKSTRNKTQAKLVPDGEGGVYTYTGENDVLCSIQRLNSAGISVWRKAIVDSNYSPNPPIMKAFRNDGLIYMYLSQPIINGAVSYNRAYIQYVNKLGQRQWGEKGILLGDVKATSHGYFDFCVNDNNIIAFVMNENCTGINAFSISHSGRKLWDGYKQFSMPAAGYSPTIHSAVSAGQDGALVLYSKGYAYDTASFYVQKINAAGNWLFQDTGKLVLNRTTEVSVMEDNTGNQPNGFYIAGARFPDGPNFRIMLQHVDSNANMRWVDNGIQLHQSLFTSRRFYNIATCKDSTSSNINVLWGTYPTIGSFGYFMLDPTVSINGQSVTTTGLKRWGDDGRLMGTGVQLGNACVDSSGNVLTPLVNYDGKIYLQKFDQATGDAMFAGFGAAVSARPAFQSSYRPYDTLPEATMTYVPGTGSVVTWNDFRLPMTNRYSNYIERVLDNGTMSSRTSYTFVGNGLWTDATNWIDGAIPPSIIPSGVTITVAPSPGDSCVLNTTQSIQTGGIFNVLPGTNFIVRGGLGTTNYLAQITTAPISNLQLGEATSGGIIQDDGGSFISSKGLVWDSLPNPTIATAMNSSFGQGADNFPVPLQVYCQILLIISGPMPSMEQALLMEMMCL